MGQHRMKFCFGRHSWGNLKLKVVSRNYELGTTYLTNMIKAM